VLAQDGAEEAPVRVRHELEAQIVLLHPRSHLVAILAGPDRARAFAHQLLRTARALETGAAEQPEQDAFGVDDGADRPPSLSRAYRDRLDVVVGRARQEGEWPMIGDRFAKPSAIVSDDVLR
jgi:hypothetical protein